jgi:hypothetical protein
MHRMAPQAVGVMNDSSFVDYEVPEPVAYGDVASAPEEQRDV